MKTMSADEARNQFKDALVRVRYAPIQINRNGEPVAVMMSMADYEKLEALKVQMLKDRVIRAKTETATGQTIDGEALFTELLAEHEA